MWLALLKWLLSALVFLGAVGCVSHAALTVTWSSSIAEDGERTDTGG